MTTNETLEHLLRSYIRYYDIYREDITEGFAAEAHFHSHDEQYWLTKSVKLAEADSHEYVFFALAETLSAEDVESLVDKAWASGTGRVQASYSHHSSDVALVILADTIEPDAVRTIKKARRFASYKFGLHGFSHLRLIAFEPTSKKIVHNRMGDTLKKLFRNI